jgi:hypothetical protein
MTAMPFSLRQAAEPALTPREAAIARSVLYASLFDYPLTLAQLRQTLIESRQTPSEILATLGRSRALQALVSYTDGFFFPAGQERLIAERRRREARSRAFLRAHRPMLRLIAALPYVRLVALSGSIAHLNLESGGDLDLFVVTRGKRVWSTAVAMVLLAKLLGRRRALCTNFVVADSALAFEPADLFTASQIVNLKPLAGADVYPQLLDENPSVRRFYPNLHLPDSGGFALPQSAIVRWTRRALECVLRVPSAIAEQVCRRAYGRYLRARSSSWTSPDQVRLDDSCLKLHTRSHRVDVMQRFDAVVRQALD